MTAEAQRNPVPTVDIIIEVEGGGAAGEGGEPGIVLIKRKNPPYGWAIPGGFVDAGETLEEAAVREAREETSMEVSLRCQMHAYSDPARDPRFHTMSVVFVATAAGAPVAADDAVEARVFTEAALPENIAFDHARILADYFRFRREGFGVFSL